MYKNGPLWCTVGEFASSHHYLMNCIMSIIKNSYFLDEKSAFYMLMSMVIANQYRWVTRCSYFLKIFCRYMHTLINHVNAFMLCLLWKSLLFAWIDTFCKVSFPLLFIQCFEPIRISLCKDHESTLVMMLKNCAKMFFLNQKYQCFIPCKKFVFILANHFLKSGDILVKKNPKKILGFYP